MPGISEAVQAHARGEYEIASKYYSAALEAGENSPVLFQNFGALARKLGNCALAEEIFDKGLKLYPQNPGILANRVNLIKDKHPISALADLVFALDKDPSLIESWLTLLSLIHEQGCFAWALEVAKEALKTHPRDARLWFRVLAIITAFGNVEEESLTEQEDRIIALIDELMVDLPEYKRTELKIAMASYGQSRNRSDIAGRYYEGVNREILALAPRTRQDKAEKEKLYHVSSWNYGNYLLTNQNFELGWRLYEHGLCTPCDDKNGQKWQRALYKPYHSDELPLWRGEPLRGKNLLVLAEQGIGDTISFLSLLPTLEEEGAVITVLTSDRLSTSFSQYSSLKARFIRPSDIKTGIIHGNQFDYQTAAGSICHHRFKHPCQFAPQTPMLSVPIERKEFYRNKYKIKDHNHKLIGVSWRGGATKNRKLEKSLGFEYLMKLLQPRRGVTFISLQYGDVRDTIHSLSQKGIELLCDDEIDAIHGFPGWLEQTASCDAVISVANTTIHASGSLGIPTMCLLGRKSDWRWLCNPQVTRSYWYKSVGIARQAHNGSWDQAIQAVSGWLDNGCKLPQGRAWLEPDGVG